MATSYANKPVYSIPVGDDYKTKDTPENSHHVYDLDNKSWTRVHTHHGDRVESPVSKLHQIWLNKEHKNAIAQANENHQNILTKNHEKILTNIVKHRNTPLSTIQDLSNHENPVISNIAQDRLSNGRISKIL